MPPLKIVKYPNKTLQERSEGVVEVDAEVSLFIDDLVETMRGSTGVGIAAPQVGRLLRIIVVDVTPKNPGHGELVLINPKITAQSGKRKGREGCLSVPGFIANIKRSRKVTVSALDRDGEAVEIEASGFEAVALQHEIDHLDGILFLDHITDMKRDLLKRKPEED
ncbi:MAG: peptide deformylase [Proteobacteria bacterium]|nr:peptide deformylase [Pseudomonadota bacterium]